MHRLHWPTSLPPIAGMIAGVGVFVAVMLVTPPGFAGLPALAPGRPRGVESYAAAYALGAAASLALLTLLVVGAVLGGLSLLLARQTRRTVGPVPRSGSESFGSPRMNP